jgi:hypothetical protein
MGPASDIRRAAATVSPVYCNQFSRRCNCFFQKKQGFFKNFFHWGSKQPPNCPDRIPKPAKETSQELSGGHFPCRSSQHQSHGAAQPDVPTAHEKIEPQPRPRCGGNENRIGEIGHFPPYRPQKSIQHPKSHAIDTGGEKPQRGNGRHRHPNSLLAQPEVCRGCS